MVYFRDSISKKPALIIVNCKTDSDRDGSSFSINEPLYGDFATKYSKEVIPAELSEWSRVSYRGLDRREKVSVLNSSNHGDAGSSLSYHLLGRSIISGESQWGTSFRVNGEFTHTPLYWEWLEVTLSRNKSKFSAYIYDAVYASLFPYDRDANIIRAFLESWSASTNTLHVSTGELSLSLWDLRQIGGLPVEGIFYDEVIPSSIELTGVNCKNRPFLPPCCQFLFAAYFHLQGKGKKGDKVTISDWIKFWFKGQEKYHQGTKRKASSTVYPSSEIGPHAPWSVEDEQVFSLLGVGESSKDLTYAAAFIACWLCVFVLPVSHFIRPSTFVMASLIAAGRTVSLAVPVLALIYKGLREISNSSSVPGKCKTYFPAHYVYAWLSRYFGTHKINTTSGPCMVRSSGVNAAISYSASEARELIRSGKNISWDATIPKNRGGRLLNDDGRLSFTDMAYFISMRSSYLLFRQDGTTVIEPYSPHRFSRQFGFHQDIPGNLLGHDSSNTIEYLYRISWSCTRRSTHSVVRVPVYGDGFEQRVTDDYVAWWGSINGDYFLKPLIEAPLVRVEPYAKKAAKLKLVTRPPRGKVLSKTLQLEFPTVEPIPLVHTSDGEKASSDVNWKHKDKRTKSNPLEDIFNEGLLMGNGDDLRGWEDDFPLGVVPSKSECSALAGELRNLIGDDVYGSNNVSDEEVSSTIGGMLPPTVLVAKSMENASNLPQASEFHIEVKVSEFRVQTSRQLGRCILDRLSRLPLSDVANFKYSVDMACQEIDHYGVIDSSRLRNIVYVYMDDVAKYLHHSATLEQQVTLSQRDSQFDEIDHDMSIANSAKEDTGIYMAAMRTEFSELERQLALWRLESASCLF